MKKHRKILILSSLLVIIFSLTGCSSSSKKVDRTKVRNELDTYLTEKMRDGTIENIRTFWYDRADTGKVFDFSALDANNGTISFGTRTAKPFSFLKDNEWTGMTIEIIYLFCKEKGYGITIKDFGDNNSLVMATSTGKCDIGGSNMSITEGRKKSVDFSVPYYKNRYAFTIHKDNVDQYQKLEDFNGVTIGTVLGSSIPDFAKTVFTDFKHEEFNTLADGCLAVSQKKIESYSADEIILHYAIKSYPELVLAPCALSEDDYFGFVFAKEGNNIGLWSSLVDSFNRTFVEENRWQLVLKGVGNTLLITLSSIVSGTALGFVVYLLCKKGGKISNSITGVCQRLIDGLPVVVFLMILYYIVFGNIQINHILVSIIAFSLIFASAIFTMVKNAVSGIDYAQYEVSYALGYSENQTFYKMILPQAAKLFWTPCQSAVKAQIKATAIVGYIAALDLTKAGDMIRSSTFDAFFPLITIAVLYFLLGWFLAVLVDRIRIKTEPSAKKSERYLKGVQTHD